MDKVTFNNFTVLYICLSQKWSSIERRALFDATFLRNCGGNPVILCYKNTQMDREAKKEAIPRIFIEREQLKINRLFTFVKKMKKELKEDRFEIVHCYDLVEFWLCALLMKSKLHVSLILTFNQHVTTVYHSFISRWLLKRVDNILTLSKEINDFVKEGFSVSTLKVRNIGFGLDLLRPDSEKIEQLEIACVVDNLSELQRLRTIVQVFGFLKTHHEDLVSNLKFSIYLGPRVFNKKNAKNILTELSHEFYQSDIMIYELSERSDRLKNLCVLIGVAFEEPLNDYEMRSLLHKIPVLFPRTAARQSLLFRNPGIGESYLEGDIREATAKLVKIIKSHESYTKALSKHSAKILDVHGIDTYALGLKQAYENSFAKRQRYLMKKRFLSKSS